MNETVTESAAPKLHMPRAEAEAVRTAYRTARAIVEYGTGGSTLFASAESQATLLGIESDAGWLEKLEGWLGEAGGRREGINLRHIDVGPVGAWGVPKDCSGYRNYPAYALSPWVDPVPGMGAPDLVFIDGRFRLACFAATLVNITAPVTVLWDDYQGRPGYHAAEAFAGKPEMIGRMALFELKPRQFSGAEISRVIPWFVIPR